MISAAVSPITAPIRTRLSRSLATICRTGEPGYSMATVTKLATNMKQASSAASMRYSGQWPRILLTRCARDACRQATPGTSTARGAARRRTASSTPRRCHISSGLRSARCNTVRSGR